MVLFLLRQIAYCIEGLKYQCIVLFYSALIITLLMASGSIQPPTQAAVAHAAALPYTAAHPYDYRLAAEQVQQTAAAAAAAAPVWPLHGRVTTEFGAVDYPYQSSHTGIDISSGKPSGASTVVAFKAGMVMGVYYGSTHYGNHLIIDHGNGLTSLYGHLYSVRVSAGQIVQAGDVIGTEGSTGDSTGTHLHFEIRQNNKPQNPRRYIAGNP